MGLLEIAHNGTLFVDEVGDMGLSIQAKDLRVLEAGTFIFIKLGDTGDTKETKINVRFIFATNKEIKSEIDRGNFRKWGDGGT